MYSPSHSISFYTISVTSLSRLIPTHPAIVRQGRWARIVISFQLIPCLMFASLPPDQLASMLQAALSFTYSYDMWLYIGHIANPLNITSFCPTASLGIEANTQYLVIRPLLYYNNHNIPSY